ncbi:type II secretion system protein [Pelomonas sp. KK5]|uniref:type II secretion system protein n=1 Tax=Pelomonas sp. KK5 TaxID=1855730 RepID=UPI00097C7303|nr:prepilin-type N-terminal cleavage/methylation domain-containing protein [Pelomonas sp. KK5]
MSSHRPRLGFTLIELLVVMAIIATLLTIASPRYFGSVERSKEASLRQSLAVMREAIDKFYGDNGKYPQSLAELAERRYLRAVPVDPVTGSADTWTTVAPPDTSLADKLGGGSSTSTIYDVHSGAAGRSASGAEYGAL